MNQTLKVLLFTLFSTFACSGLQAQITISEILFEQPLWDTDLQYIELLNYSEDTINLSEWSIGGDITLSTLPNFDLLPGENLVFTGDMLALLNQVFMPVISNWAPNDQISGSPFFQIFDPNGQEVVRIEYDEALNWPVPSSGVAIELCDPTLNINDGLNWALAENSILSGSNELLGTPSVENSCSEISTSSINFNQSEEIVLYPNPSNSILNIKGIEIFESIYSV